MGRGCGATADRARDGDTSAATRSGNCGSLVERSGVRNVQCSTGLRKATAWQVLSAQSECLREPVLNSEDD